MKKLVLALFALMFANAALAEGFSSPMTDSGWAYGGGVATGTNVRSEHMIMQMSNLPKVQRWYDITFTVSGYSCNGGGSACSMRPVVGIQMPAAPAGAWVDKSTITPVADRFTLALGTPLTGPYDSSIDMTAAPNNITGPGLSGEDIGSMRIFCSHAWFGAIDPIAYPNLIGAGHFHEGIGNDSVKYNWVYNDFRTKGSSTCQDNTGAQAKYPVNPSGYWWPAVMTEINGKLYLIQENQTLIYYKGPPGPPGAGIDYDAVQTFGGILSSNGTTTVTRISGYTFNNGCPGNCRYPVGTSFYIGPNRSSTQYTVASITDADHLVLTTSVPANASQHYNLFPKEIFNAAYNQCNDEWGRADLGDLTHDQTGATVTEDGRCPQWPDGIKFIFGYNKATGQGRPDVFPDITTGDNGTGAVTSGTKGAIVVECWNGPDISKTIGPEFTESAHAAASASGGNTYESLDALHTAVVANPSYCPLGSVIHYSYGGPSCWDGHHIDSPDHRGHVAYGVRPTTSGWLGNQRCPQAIPYPMPQMGVQNFYTVDQSFRDGKWRVSMDDMADGLPPGIGSHMDYIFAWSPTASNLWFSRCVHPHNSCTNILGDGYNIPGPVNWDRTGAFCNGCAHTRPDRFERTEYYGMGYDIRANGTYTIRIKSAGAAQWGFVGLNGFNGSISGVSIVPAPSGAKGPVTVSGGGMAANDNAPTDKVAANDNRVIEIAQGSHG